MVFVKILIKAILFSILNLQDDKKFKEKGFKMFIIQITNFDFHLYLLTSSDLIFKNKLKIIFKMRH